MSDSFLSIRVMQNTPRDKSRSFKIILSKYKLIYNNFVDFVQNDFSQPYFESLSLPQMFFLTDNVKNFHLPETIHSAFR